MASLTVSAGFVKAAEYKKKKQFTRCRCSPLIYCFEQKHHQSTVTYQSHRRSLSVCIYLNRLIYFFLLPSSFFLHRCHSLRAEYLISKCLFHHLHLIPCVVAQVNEQWVLGWVRTWIARQLGSVHLTETIVHSTRKSFDVNGEKITRECLEKKGS